MSVELLLTIGFGVLAVCIILLVMHLEKMCDRSRAKRLAEEKKRIVYKDVGQMVGSWVIDGVRLPVAFLGRYDYNADDDSESIVSGSIMFESNMKYAGKTGFMLYHDYEGVTKYTSRGEGDEYISIDRISEIDVQEESCIVLRELED